MQERVNVPALVKSHMWQRRSNAGQERKGKVGLNSLHWKSCEEGQTTELKKEWVRREGMFELLVIAWETWSRCAVWSSVDQMTYQRSGQPLATCLFLLSSLICNWLSVLTPKISILHTLVDFQEPYTEQMYSVECWAYPLWDVTKLLMIPLQLGLSVCLKY